MKVHIDLGKCTGNARCYSIDPDLFEIDDSGYAVNAEIDLPPDAFDKGRDAVAACPERAITLLS